MKSADQYDCMQNLRDTVCLMAGGNKLKINLYRGRARKTVKGTDWPRLINRKVVTCLPLVRDMPLKKATAIWLY